MAERNELTIDDEVLLEARTDRARANPRDQGYNPRDPESLQRARSRLAQRLGDSAPTLVHSDPDLLTRIFRFFIGERWTAANASEPTAEEPIQSSSERSSEPGEPSARSDEGTAPTDPNAL